MTATLKFALVSSDDPFSFICAPSRMKRMLFLLKEVYSQPFVEAGSPTPSSHQLSWLDHKVIEDLPHEVMLFREGAVLIRTGRDSWRIKHYAQNASDAWSAKKDLQAADKLVSAISAFQNIDKKSSAPSMRKVYQGLWFYYKTDEKKLYEKRLPPSDGVDFRYISQNG